MSEIKVQIKTPSKEKNLEVSLNSSYTVQQAKESIAKHCDTPAERQRLIFAGRVLKDHQVLSDCKIVDGVTVHMVPMPNAAAAGAPPRASPNPTPSSAAGASPSGQSQGQPGLFGMPNLGGLFGSFGSIGQQQQQAQQQQQGNFMEQMQQNIMQNPEMMQQLMQNPMVQQLNQRLMNDPELLRGLIENNPQIQQVIESNPEVGHVLRDPSMLRQAMELSQNPELMREMMRNNDRTMSHIENMPGGFNFLRQQYENVVEPMQNAVRPPTQEDSTGNTADEPPSATPNSNPLPNPWAAPGSANRGSTNATPSASTSSPSGATGSSYQNPFSSLFSSPDDMARVMDMTRQMFGDQQAGAGGSPDMGRLMNMFYGMNGGNAPAGSNPSGAGTGFSGSAPSQASSQMSPEARYAVQLQQLNDMGFNDQAANIRCLIATGGNVNAAIERLLSGL